ncbi:MAG: exopolysaccharide biosynthesis protein [Roseateles sp.]|uniref:exopolysaccharide biosynthesis protein n=1 Tax=Roseateles sp. TaxID=1971397 RepID=UPI00403721DA
MSAALASRAAETGRERVSLQDLLNLLGDRAVAALLLIFALPNVIPVPPGASAILGLPMLMLAAQLTLGSKPWLPAFVAQRSLSHAQFVAVVARISPWLQRAERRLRPRWPAWSGHSAERLVGLVCLVLSVVVFLPIPLGNMLPAFAVCVLCLGLMERDGLWVAFGLLVGAAALLLVAGVIYAIARTVLFLIANAFT